MFMNLSQIELNPSFLPDQPIREAYTCIACKESLPLCEFTVRKNGKRRHKCKSCRKKYKSAKLKPTDMPKSARSKLYDRSPAALAAREASNRAYIKSLGFRGCEVALRVMDVNLALDEGILVRADSCQSCGVVGRTVMTYEEFGLSAVKWLCLECYSELGGAICD